MSFVSELPVVVSDSFEVLFHLGPSYDPLDDVLCLESHFENLLDDFGGKLVELLPSEGEPWHLFRFNTFGAQEVSNPVNDMYTVHAGHLVVYDDERDLVEAQILVEVADGTSYRVPTVVEANLTRELELVEQDALQRYLSEHLILENENLGSHDVGLT